MANLVPVEVVEVRRSGILVRILTNHEIGFVRQRELSWDRRVGFTAPMPEVGQKLMALLLQDKRGGYLSLRRTIDPWQDAHKKFRKGQVVRAEVVNIRHFAAFVQIEPGIDAVIWPREIPFLHDQLPTDVLSIGDQVEGVITNFYPKRQKMEMSLIERLEELDLALDERKSIQLELFKDLNAKTNQSLIGPTTSDNKPRHYHHPIPPPNRLLVVDDEEFSLQEVRDHLKSEFYFEIDGVQSGTEALNKLKERSDYGIAVIDIKLNNERGAKVAEELLHLKPDLAIIFTSSNPLVKEDEITIDGWSFPFAFKEPEEIANWVENLCNGYWEEKAKMAEVAYKGQGNFIRQLGMSALARRSLPEVLPQMLAKVREETNLSQAVVLEVDSINKQVSILAADPPLDEEIEEYSLDGLYYSPVRNVVEKEEEFYATHIQQDRSLRFKNFFQLLMFKTSFGIPLKIPDLVTRHALFLLDEQKEILDEEVRDQVREAGQLIQVALERALLLDYMRRYEQRYTLGQLLGSLVHEFRTKLDGLGAYSLTLSAILQKANRSRDTTYRSKQINDALKMANRITQAKSELGELVQAYSRMVTGNLEAVDVEEVVRKVKRQMDFKALEANVKIDLDLQANLPVARAIESRLTQIVANVVLNAIQQIEKQAKRMAQIAQEKGERYPLLQNGYVTVQTRYNESNTLCPIQINVLDTGPGIHYHQQESIFLLDTSTRPEGQGLGLYISRNLAETMGGRLRLADNIMFIGSAFVVELPPY